MICLFRPKSRRLISVDPAFKFLFLLHLVTLNVSILPGWHGGLSQVIFTALPPCPVISRVALTFFQVLNYTPEWKEALKKLKAMTLASTPPPTSQSRAYSNEH